MISNFIENWSSDGLDGFQSSRALLSKFEDDVFAMCVLSELDGALLGFRKLAWFLVEWEVSA